MKMARHLVQGEVLQRRRHGALNLERRAHANRVSHTDMLHPNTFHEARQIAHTLGRHLAFVGTTHSARHRATNLDTSCARRRHHRSKALNALGDRTVDVALAEGLAGCGKHHDFIRPAGVGCLKALQIRGEHRVAHAHLARDASHHLGVVSHLGHPFGRHKTGHLNVFQASGLQPVHQLDLDCGRHGLLFVLQTVARANINNFDACGKFHLNSHGWG